jgi:hypothetical protein
MPLSNLEALLKHGKISDMNILEQHKSNNHCKKSMNFKAEIIKDVAAEEKRSSFLNLWLYW